MDYVHFVESKNSAGLLVISTLTDAVTSQIDILCDTIKGGKIGCHSRLGPNRNSLAFPASFQSYYHIGKLIIEGMMLAETVPASCEDDDAVLMRYIHMSVESNSRIRSIYKASQAFAPVHRAIISRQSEAPLQMKRALHMASMDDAYARLVFYVAIGWSTLPFSG